MNDFAMPHGDLLIAPEQQAWVESLLAKISEPQFAQTFNQKLEDAKSVESAHNDDDGFWTEFAGTRMEQFRPYNVKGGVLTIPVKGMLMKDFPFTAFGMITGYEYIERAVERGLADPDVHTINMDENSPGGTVSGCFDCADRIYEMSQANPDTKVVAYANEHAYSAAYAIASAADEIVVARTGGVGSIGVITAHVDASKAYEARGIKVTPVYAGAHKADGNQFEPLPDDVKARMQERVDALYGIFVSTVARNRGLDEAAVRETEAATFMAQEAVEKGLADAVGSLGTLSASADESNDNQEDQAMTDVTQADHDAAVAAATETGKSEGASAERARVSAILGSDEAKTRPTAAQMMIDLGVDADQAKAQMAKLPEETKEEEATAPAGGSAFENAMNGTENPNVGAEANGGEGGEQLTTSDSIFASAGFDPVKQ